MKKHVLALLVVLTAKFASAQVSPDVKFAAAFPDRTCDGTMRVVNCELRDAIPEPDFPTPVYPSPGVTRTPNGVDPTPVATSGTTNCPSGSLDLATPLPTNATLQGFIFTDLKGTGTIKLCGKSNEHRNVSGHIGTAWYDGAASPCTKSRLRLLSFNGSTTYNGNLITSNTSMDYNTSLTYKFSFPGAVAPFGTYAFEMDYDASGCGNRTDGGRILLIWSE